MHVQKLKGSWAPRDNYKEDTGKAFIRTLLRLVKSSLDVLFSFIKGHFLSPSQIMVNQKKGFM